MELIIVLIFTALFLVGIQSQNLDEKLEESSYFAICVIARDEPDLPEWIEYHQRLGASKIYLYDQDSSPPLLNFIIPFVESGLVEYKWLTSDFKQSLEMQTKVYGHCLKHYSKYHQFIAFIDVDEFIVVKDKTKSIPEFLKNYEQFGGLALNWKMFGSSGHVVRPTGGVLANYNMCSNNPFVKTIVNTKIVLTNKNSYKHIVNVTAHMIQTSMNSPLVTNDTFYYTVDPSMSYVVQASFNPPQFSGLNVTEDQYDLIYINHYWAKSLQDFVAKIARRKNNLMATPDLALFESYNDKAVNDCGFLEMPPKI
jgi:hypothetical protein